MLQSYTRGSSANSRNQKRMSDSNSCTAKGQKPSPPTRNTSNVKRPSRYATAHAVLAVPPLHTTTAVTESTSYVQAGMYRKRIFSGGERHIFPGASLQKQKLTTRGQNQVGAGGPGMCVASRCGARAEAWPSLPHSKLESGSGPHGNKSTKITRRSFRLLLTYPLQELRESKHEGSG